MKIQNYEELQLGGEMFEEIRESFDSLLQKLFKKMEDNNSDEGEIDLKLKIGIRTEWIPDQAAKGGTHQVNMPVIKHKITTQVPVKDALDGSKDTGMALVYDEELKRYVLKYVSFGDQMSIYDMEFPDDDGMVVGQNMVEGKTILQIEDKGTDEGGAGEPDSSDTDAAESGPEASDSEDGGFIEVPDENGAKGTTGLYDDDYVYDDPGYDEPC